MIGFMLVPACEMVMLIGIGCCAFLMPSVGIYFIAITSLVMALTSIVLLFYNMKRVVASTETRARNHYLEQQQQLQLEHYASLQAQMQHTRKLRHDIANHLQTVQTLIAQEHYRDASGYFKIIGDEFGKAQSVDYCANLVVNALLFNKVEYAHTKGIKMDIQLLLAADTPIADIDLIGLFSNLLDNAIDLCATYLHPRRLHFWRGIIKIHPPSTRKRQRASLTGCPLPFHFTLLSESQICIIRSAVSADFVATSALYEFPCCAKLVGLTGDGFLAGDSLAVLVIHLLAGIIRRPALC